MRNPAKPLISVSTALLAALCAMPGAHALEITLPPETATYQASELPGYRLVQQNCLVCHSAQYVQYQPTSARGYWEATVKKMKKTFGAPFPDAIGDEFFNTPLTSYGTQKTIGELLISDYSRKGFIDGISIRLPTICVRPGRPNKAASGFFSNIMREPLAGEEAVLPVSESVTHWHASPRTAVGFMLHAASLDLDRLGWRRALTMPGLAVTVGEQIAALHALRSQTGAHQHGGIDIAKSCERVR